MKEPLQLEIWDRLIRGKSLDDLYLGEKAGRIDLSGLNLPEPSVLRRFKFQNFSVTEIEPGAVFHRAKWRGLDFTGSQLNGLRFFESEIIDCLFENCQMRDFRLWATRITETSFRGADLRKAVLGGVQDGKRNVFAGVDFTKADLRETVYKAAEFERCKFADSRLEKVDFQTSTFCECNFEGLLLRVIFYYRAFKGESFPANEMINVDFSRAILRYVEFRGLRLGKVRLPDNGEHIVITDYNIKLDKLIAGLQECNDTASRKLAAYLGVFKKWAAPDQVQGVLNIEDLSEIGGLPGVNRVRELLSQC